MELAKTYYCHTIKINPHNIRALYGLLLVSYSLFVVNFCPDYYAMKHLLTQSRFDFHSTFTDINSVGLITKVYSSEEEGVCQISYVVSKAAGKKLRIQNWSRYVEIIIWLTILELIIAYYNIYCNSNVYKHTGESGSTNNDMWMLDGLLGQLQIQPPSSSS